MNDKIIIISLLSILVVIVVIVATSCKNICNKHCTERFEYVDNSNIEAGIKMSEINTKLFKLNDKNIFDLIYPVGAIYISMKPDNPKDLFGVGEWKQITNNRFLLCSNSAEKTGGSSKISTNQLPSHSHSININTNTTGNHNHTFTGNAITGSVAFRGPEYKHREQNGCLSLSEFKDNYGGGHDPGNSHSVKINFNATPSGTIGNSGNHSHTVSGNSGATGNSTDYWPPYITCYAWQRTA